MCACVRVYDQVTYKMSGFFTDWLCHDVMGYEIDHTHKGQGNRDGARV